MSATLNDSSPPHLSVVTPISLESGIIDTITQIVGVG